MTWDIVPWLLVAFLLGTHTRVWRVLWGAVRGLWRCATCRGHLRRVGRGGSCERH